MTDPMNALRLLSEFALVALVPLLIWNARLMVDFRDGLRELRQATFGIDGSNGLNSEVKALRHACTRTEAVLAEHTFRLEEQSLTVAALKAESR